MTIDEVRIECLRVASAHYPSADSAAIVSLARTFEAYVLEREPSLIDRAAGRLQKQAQVVKTHADGWLADS